MVHVVAMMDGKERNAIFACVQNRALVMDYVSPQESVGVMPDLARLIAPLSLVRWVAMAMGTVT